MELRHQQLLQLYDYKDSFVIFQHLQAIESCNTKIWRGMRHQVFAHLIPMFFATFVKITIGHMRSRFQVRSSGSRICSSRVQNEKRSWGFLKHWRVRIPAGYPLQLVAWLNGWNVLWCQSGLPEAKKGQGRGHGLMPILLLHLHPPLLLLSYLYCGRWTTSLILFACFFTCFQSRREKLVDVG